MSMFGGQTYSLGFTTAQVNPDFYNWNKAGLTEEQNEFNVLSKGILVGIRVEGPPLPIAVRL